MKPPFGALADPTRITIIELLARKPRSAGEISARFEMTAPAVSQHLKILREAGLVQVQIDAQRRIYSLNRAGFDDISQWLGGIRAFWNGRLDVLEQQLVRERKR